MNSNKLYIHTPIVLLTILWTIVLYLNVNNPYHFLVISNDTLKILLIGLLSIVLGYYFIGSFYLNTSKDSTNIRNIIIDSQLLGQLILTLSAFVLLGIILIGMQIASVTNNFRLYVENPYLARATIVMIQEGEINGISPLLYKLGAYLCSILFPLAVLGGVMMAQNSKWKFTGLIPLILIVVYSIMNLNRFGLIMSFGLWFLSIIYYSYFLPKEEQKQFLKKILVYSVIAIVFIVSFFLFIVRWRATYVLDVEYYATRSMYAYLAGPSSAFDKFLYYDPPLSFGVASFRSLVKWFANLGLMDKGLVIGAYNNFYNIGQGEAMALNTFTFAKSPYQDFGIIGLSVICILWGAFTRYSIENLFRKFSFVKIFIVSLLVLTFIMSFYEFSFQAITTYMYWGIIVFFSEKYLMVKGGLALNGK